ncbi:hypothetical protein MIR68_011323 [Amoeboaphelidium protococcarum]|nr:hypothetical protein MIR68_011323 [Amoeboaphelidium protococcarum]KAI3644127.1 hypothetical protein MP228_010291 [Amoeboaphelidium protococcarum]
MPRYQVPWSSLLPIAGITGLCVATGSMLDWYYRSFETQGLPRRRAMDYFDYVMEERDEKITGSMYRQQVKY